ncbi:uncharacterized protein lrif1 isoform X3 [Syngnathoides biaculeatus]|uniref:uncharacterized protein lrif1 isoform X3 n=1 Tax=Syngnathoides biaculeatus TaxID=300417 RepID=UPI002ADDB1A0|nr:uncharacterized protein lrif1 isoform X3 [Syngnathoides biaculeatus]
MYSASREDNAAQSGTGVFYQALPALGADGKNIMVLIPVQMVNGKCVQTQINKPKTQDALPLNVAGAPVSFRIKTALTSLATQQSTRNVVSPANASPCEVGFEDQGQELSISSNKYPLGTIKSKTILIDSQNQVQTVAASDVPSGIKKSFMSSTDCFSSSDSTTVASLSSKTTDCQSNVSRCLSELSFCSASPMTSLPLGSPKSHLKLIPKDSQRPNSPMKWTIEEVSSEFAVDLPNSPSAPSKTFKTLESSDTVGLFEKALPVSWISNETNDKRDQQDSVVCNVKSLVGKTLEIETSTRTLHPAPECESSVLNYSNTAHVQLTSESMDDCSIDKSQKPDQSRMANTAPNDDRDSVMSRQQLDSITVSLGMESLSHPSASDPNSGESTDKTKSSTAPVCRSSDHILRQMFGVTSDVRICLQRINPESSGTGVEEPAQNVLTQDIQETTNLVKESELFMEYSYNPQDPHRSSSPVNVKRAKLSDVQNWSGDTVTTSPFAGIMVGYVEPIDDDISSIDENYIPDSSAAWSLNSALSNTSRMGRPRKRTTCPCCVPGTLGLSTRSSTRAVDSERLTWTRDHTSKRGGRQKFK